MSTATRAPQWLDRAIEPYQVADRKRRRRLGLSLVAAAVCLLLLYTASRSTDDESSDAYSYGYPPSRAVEEFDQAARSAGYAETLQSRAVGLLDQLAARPILDYATSLKEESAAGRCPDTWRQANRDMLRNEGENVWPEITPSQLEAARSKVIAAVKQRFGWDDGATTRSKEELETMLGKEGHRGIVATAGNHDTARRLLTTLRILRKHHNCELPVEIWGFPDELAGLGDVRRDIDALGGHVSWRTVEVEKRGGKWKQFHIKGEVLARSAFSEILYLDSDSVPLSDPTFLFDSPTYKQNGAVLWPDFNRDAAANPIWRLVGNLHCTPDRAWQAETGQLLIDKRARGGLNLVALEIARAMQEDEEFWFRLSGGDKDTFRYAFYLLSLPFSMAPHYPSSLGALHGSAFNGHRFCGHSMLHYGLEPEQEWSRLEARGQLAAANALSPADRQHAPPLFVHANVLKHSGWYNHRGDTFRQLKKPADDRLFRAASRLSWGRKPATPLANIRQTGLGHRGICIDVWDAGSSEGAGEEAEGAQEGLYERGEVEVLDWQTAFGGIAAGFEDMYYDEGGVAGAW